MDLLKRLTYWLRAKAASRRAFCANCDAALLDSSRFCGDECRADFTQWMQVY